MKNWLILTIVFFSASLHAQTWRIQAHVLPPHNPGLGGHVTGDFHSWGFVQINLDTGAMFFSGGLGADGLSSMPTRPNAVNRSATTARTFPHVCYYTYKRTNSSNPSRNVAEYVYEVFYATTDGSPPINPVVQNNMWEVPPQFQGGNHGELGSGATNPPPPPPPPDPEPDPEPDPDPDPNVDPPIPGFADPNSPVPDGLERHHRADLLIINTTDYEQRYLVTLSTGIGQVLKQQLVSVPAHSRFEITEWNVAPITLRATMMYQGTGSGTGGPPETPVSVEGTETAWDMPPGMSSPRPAQQVTQATGSGTSFTPGPRADGNDPNDEARHAETAGLLKGIKDEVVNARNAIRFASSDEIDAAERASAMIKNSIEFATGVLVEGLDAVSGNVSETTLAVNGDETPLTASPFDPPAPPPDEPEINLPTVQPSVDTGYVASVQAVKTAASSVQTSLSGLVTGLGLGTLHGTEALVFSLPNPLNGGSIALDLQSIGGSFFALFRQIMLAAASIVFVHSMFNVVRSAYV